MLRIPLTLHGQKWEIRFCKKIMHEGREVAGLCEINNKIIRIWTGLSGKQLAQTILHEIGHASDWHKDEPYVDDQADAMVKILFHKAIQGMLEG